MRFRFPAVLALRLLLVGCLLACLHCDQRPTYNGNPPALWMNYSTREIDLVLVDYEPPPF